VAYVYARRSPDCPPVPASSLGALPISFVLNPGTVTKTAVGLADQTNVFCFRIARTKLLTRSRAAAVARRRAVSATATPAWRVRYAARRHPAFRFRARRTATAL